MSEIKILVVDDHAIMRDGIRALLAVSAGIEIVGEAYEGREAIEKASELVPDVVLMDIAMPGMDGLEATRCITKKNSAIKVLVLTQYDSREYILSAIRAGAIGYLPKRALGSDLVSAIRIVYQGDSFLYPSAAAALIEDYVRQVKEENDDRLSGREREILKLVAEGHTSREIADMLLLSVKTVQNRRARLMERLNIHDSSELIRYAIREGLVSVAR